MFFCKDLNFKGLLLIPVIGQKILYPHLKSSWKYKIFLFSWIKFFMLFFSLHKCFFVCSQFRESVFRSFSGGRGGLMFFSLQREGAKHPLGPKNPL